MMMDKKKVLCFGELLLRLAAPGYARLFQKDSLEVTFCGSEANVAVSLAMFGLPSALVTKLPDNEIGRAAVNSLRCFGVDTGNVIYGNGRMGLYYLEKGVSQRPSRVIYDRKHSAMAMASQEEFDWDKFLADIGWFHWTGITAALSDGLASACLDACRSAKEKGITVSCDLNYRKKLWDSGKARHVMEQLMPYVDVCIGNEEDAEKVLGIHPDDNDVEGGKLNRSGYEHVADEICGRYGCRYAAVTLRESYSASRNGWSAMLYSAAERKAYFSRKYDLQLVDRIGGGDSFAAGLIYGLEGRMTDRETVEFAVAASCLKQTIEGDFNRVTVGEVQMLVESRGNGRVMR